MENVSPEFAWQVIVWLIALFGTLISGLLGLISFFAKRYVTQIDVRIREQQGEISNLKVGQARHSTEIKNIHHRLKEI